MNFTDSIQELSNRIKDSPEPLLNYEIDENEATLIIHSTRSSESLSSIMGMRATDDLILKLPQVERFPHDLVLSLFYASPPPRINGMTPDAIIGDVLIELATRKTYGTASLEKAVRDKHFKYSHLPNRLVVIAVGLMSVESNINLSDSAKLMLIKVFKYAVGIQTKYLTTTNQVPKPLYHFNESRFPEVDMKMMLPSKVSNSTFDEFMEQKGQTRFKTIVRGLPFFELSDIDEDPPLSNDDTWRSIMTFQIRFMKSQHNIPSNWHFACAQPPLQDTSADYAIPKFDEDMRLQLALSGLRAKRYKNNHSIMSNTLRKKLPVSYDSPVTHIDDFILNTFMPEKVLLDFDLMLREVIMNLKRATKNYQFIIRKVLGKPLYIVISNTRYSQQTDKPSYFSVYYKGQPFAQNLFIRTTRIKDDWFMTDFCSIDRRKAEHLIGLPYQIDAMKSMLQEQFKISKQSVNINSITKILFLITVSDNNSLSLSLQQLRYYYMELYSGFRGNDESSLKILKKLPQPCRSIMQVWLVQKLKTLHAEVVWPSQLGSIDPSDEEIALSFEKALDDLPPVRTPFGFTITNLDLMLLASYLGNLKNKDEQNEGHDSKVILEKILKREYEYRDSKRQQFVAHPLEVFQVNPDALIRGANLFKAKVSKVCESKFEEEFSRVFQSIKKSSDLSSLFSTKSSSVAIDSIIKNEDDLKTYDVRSKVFLELLKTNYKESLIHDMTDQIIDECEPTVSLFKKNQIGGVREIYILHFTFRVMIKLLEDYSRALCKMHPSEMLTKPKKRDTFIPEHELRCRSMKLRYKSTFRWSGDMTNWANLFLNDYFRVILTELLPLELRGFMNKILDKHEKKKLFLPKALLKSFLKTDTILSDPNLQRLKQEFKGKIPANVLSRQNGVYMTCISNMMQGILHYTSSVYHCCEMELLQEKLESLSTNDVKLLMDFEVSSDDEGILISLLSDNEDALKSYASTFKGVFLTMKTSVDAQFGVRTSHEKSTLSISPIFEFNSIFKARNNTAIPLIKFVFKSVMDVVSESLHTRVSSMYSLVRQAREAGASGELCRKIMINQRENYLRNLGKDLVPWFSEEIINRMPQLSVFGIYSIPPVQLCGITGVEFQNWFACRDSAPACRAMLTLGCWTMIEYRDKETATVFNMFPKTKYLKSLASVGLTQLSELTENGVRLLLKSELSPLEQYELMKIKAVTPGIAHSFAWLSRCDNTMMAPYLLLRPIFHQKTILDIVSKFDTGPEVKLSDVFPQHFEYSRLLGMCSLTSDFTEISNRPRRSKKQYYPVVSTSEHRLNYKTLLSTLWYDDAPKIGYSQFQIQLESLKHELPWIRNDPVATLKESPFEDFMTMFSFFNNYGKSSNSAEYFTYGGGHKHNFVEDIIIFNTYPMMKAVINMEATRFVKDYNWMCLEDRMFNWSTLLGQLKEAPAAVFQDIIQVLESIDEKMLDQACAQSDQVRRQFAITMRSLLKNESVFQYVNSSRTGTIFYLTPQRISDGVYRGVGRMLLKLTSCTVSLVVTDELVSTVRAPENANISDLHAQLNLLALRCDGRTRYTRAAVREDSKLSLTYNGGFRLRTSQGGYGTRFFGFKTHVISNWRPPVPGYTGMFLSDILNNTAKATAIGKLMKETHPFKDLIINQIKEARKGTMLIRLSERVDWQEIEPEVIEEKKDISVPSANLMLSDLLDIMGEFNELYGESKIEDLSGAIEDMSADLFGVSSRRMWTVEVRIDSPCYLRWASIVNIAILTDSDAYRVFMTQEEIDNEAPMFVPSIPKNHTQRWKLNYV
jgi:hypothetical protein